MEQGKQASLLGLAVSRDLISPEALVAVAMSLPDGSGLMEAVLAQGLLDAEDLELLAGLAAAGSEAQARPQADPDPPTRAGEVLGAEDPLTQEFASHPVPDRTTRASQGSALGRSVLDVQQLTTWKHYRHLEFLGEGGMGRIFKAFDPVLKREVALKFLARDEPDRILRFILEAQHQAKVDHPNICKVFEVGEWKGQSYIAMQLIRGKTLAQARGELSLEEKVGVMQVVAEAIHAAHRQGLIHRDLKPGNIMVARDGGGLKPFILDFGLARGLEPTGLTQQGVAVGTLGYMAPEQAKGIEGAVGFPADIYGMGATLYMLLAGDPPFVDSSGLELLRRTVEEEPRPMSTLDLNLPRDLDTIVLKCLEKKPGRRYASALALAEDLRRFLAGEPLLAIPLDWRDALRKKLQRNRTLSIVVGVASAAVLVLGGLGVRAQWRAHAQSLLAQRFGMEAERLAGSYRWAQMLPLHDMRPHKVELVAWMGRLETQMKRQGALARGPGNFALGQACLTLGESRRALAYLEAGWKAGHQSPECAELLGLAHVAMLREGREEAMGLSTPTLKEARMAELKRVHGDPALYYLRQSGSNPSLVQEGRIALVEDHFEEALAKAQAALHRDPWLVAANLLAGQAHLARGRRMLDTGAYEAASLDASEALAAAGRLQGTARSLVDAYTLEGDAHHLEMEVANTRGLPFTDLGEQYRLALDQALTADPEAAAVHLKAARFYRLWATAEFDAGRDPEPRLAQALDHAREAIRYNPNDAASISLLSQIYQVQAASRSNHGQDPMPIWDQGLALGQRAIDLRPQDPYFHANQGNLFKARGAYLQKHGRDPRPDLQQSLASFGTASRLSPTYYMPLLNCGISYRLLASQEAFDGGDPIPFLEQAQARYQEALQRNGRQAAIYNNLGVLCRYKAEMELRRGVSPQASYAAAATALNKALELKPGYAYSLCGLADVAALRGLGQRLAGEDPQASFHEALTQYGLALTANANDGGIHQRAGRTWVELGRFEARQGRSGRGQFNKARACFEASLRVDPDSSDTLMDLARLQVLEGALAQAAASAAKAQAISPDAVEPLLLEAEVALAEAARHAGKARTSDLDRAAAALDTTESRQHWNPLRKVLRAQHLLLQEGVESDRRARGLQAESLLQAAFREDRLLSLRYEALLQHLAKAK